ncbi:hypothetical protein [Mesorhizobium amorphae]|uniref:hypothetical protein n=1 Tax=Mesorhizobium amorphae TaxID=71433 RepID=UPI0011831FB9|nr:hypothetical protein [Mesorhizobium amorphae]
MKNGHRTVAAAAAGIAFFASAAVSEDQSQTEDINGRTDWLAHIEVFDYANPWFFFQLNSFLSAMMADPDTAPVDQMAEGLELFWQARRQEIIKARDKAESERARLQAEQDAAARKAADEAARKKAAEEQQLRDELRGGRQIDRSRPIERPDPPQIEKPRPIEKPDKPPRVIFGNKPM